MAERPNFYVLLDLDPSVRDWSTIEDRIRTKRDQWARERTQGHPKARARAEECQKLLPEIERSLRDPASREREALEAEQILAGRREAQAAELDELIDLIRSGGGSCDRSRLDQLVGRFAPAFSRDQIVDRLRRAGVEVEGATGSEGESGREDEPQPFDRTTARDIRQKLDILGLRDLYELLGLPKDSPPEALRARAAVLYRDNRADSLYNARATAENDLAARCETVFATPESKASYDRYLTVEAMERLADRIDIAAEDGLLTREEMDALVRRAVELGVEADVARAYLRDLARERGWVVDPGAPVPAPDRPTPRETASRAGSAGIGSYLALLAPYLHALARRPALAVPGALAGLGMAAVLVTSVIGPGQGPPPVAQAAAASTPQAGSTSPQPPQSSPQSQPQPRPQPPTASAAGGSSGSGGSAGSAASASAAAAGTAGASRSRESVAAGGPAVPPVSPSATESDERTAQVETGEAGPAAPGQGGQGGVETSRRSVPRAAALPRDPLVAVVAVGDERIEALVEETVGSALGGIGLEVRDNRGSLALADVLRSYRGDPPLRRMADTLAADGFDVLVLAELDPVGRRDLEFYGRRETATTYQVRLNAYSLVDQRSLGDGWVGEMNVTRRGASRQVEQGVGSGAEVVAGTVRRGWDRLVSRPRGRP